MKLKLALFAGVAALAVPALAPASAQAANVYINGGYTRFEGDGSAELGAITGRVGVGFGRHFAVEGEASLGVDDDAGTELDSELGLYGVGKIPLGEKFEIFGRVGVSRIETSPGGDEDGLAYGAGAQFFFTPNDGIRGDWTRHDYDVGEADAYSISYVRKF
jgi:outer membrane immunogenic protein